MLPLKVDVKISKFNHTLQNTLLEFTNLKFKSMNYFFYYFLKGNNLLKINYSLCKLSMCMCKQVYNYCILSIVIVVHCKLTWIEQKGMTFENDFCYSFPLFSSLLTNEGRWNRECIAKIVIKRHAFLLDHLQGIKCACFKTRHSYSSDIFCAAENRKIVYYIGVTWIET